ncbi:hypothetical protein IHE56_16045, partial [Streptomyces sp. ID01-12c]|nr:hypothetical protein [Streptomyces caniscabiei]
MDEKEPTRRAVRTAASYPGARPLRRDGQRERQPQRRGQPAGHGAQQR